MKVPGSTLAKREWLKWLRGLGDDSEINGIISELGKLEFGKLGPELKVVLKTVLARRKDSKGRFEAKHWVLRAELWSKQKRLFRGSPEALAEYLCI